MNTQVAIVLSAVIVASGIVVASALRSDDGPSDTPSTEQDTPAVETTDAGTKPALMNASSDHQALRTQRELAEAQAEIQRLKDQMAGLAKPADVSADSPAFTQKRDRFFELTESYGAGTASKEEDAELHKLTQDKTLMGLVVKELNARIDADPDDLASRMQLAEVESARVHSAEGITERAAIGRSVGEQIKAVLERDPEHWDARYMQAVGISHSQRTPQGRTEAVRAFESLVTLQQSRAPEPRFARTYGQLASVYLSERNITKAREALQQGLARYPEAKDLREQLAKLPNE